MEDNTIYFYSADGPYGYFSNFSDHPIEYNGATWPTSEHAFQAAKFHDETYREKIRAAKTPSGAFRLGRSRKVPIRADWDQVKADIMREIIMAKFTQHRDLMEALVATGDRPIVKFTSRDKYWAASFKGGHLVGQNMLGKILCDVRREIIRVNW
jgi:N-glycosidase YbiA